MKRFLSVAVFAFVLAAGSAIAAGYDAAADYMCGPGSSDVWSFEGYRASDGVYLPMVYGRAPLDEVTKYGMEANYIPDSGQMFYPFILKFDEELVGSPATTGARFDAVVTWTAPEDAEARFTGFAKLLGDMRGGFAGKKIKAMLLRGAEELWSSDIPGGQAVEFDVSAEVSAGDKVRMHLVNAGDRSGNLTAIDMKVSTTQR